VVPPNIGTGAPLPVAGASAQNSIMRPSDTERRIQPRNSRIHSADLRLHYWARGAGRQIIPARLLNISESGVGAETRVPLDSGASVSTAGQVVVNAVLTPISASAKVAYCRPSPGGLYRIGLAFEKIADQSYYSSAKTEAPAPPQPEFVDHYEVMQLSPNVALETIHQVYRVLAKRYHPDNLETGDEEIFKQILKAYSVLSDPQERTAYDEERAAHRPGVKAVSLPNAPANIAVEKAKRQKILSLLYAKRLHQPDDPYLGPMELEALTGVPREHLEFTLWYLRESGWVVRNDTGRHYITVKGVDQAEAQGLIQPLMLETQAEGFDDSVFSASSSAAAVKLSKSPR